MVAPRRGLRAVPGTAALLLLAACASGPAPGETVTTRHRIGDPGDPCSYERTLSLTGRPDGSPSLAHGSMIPPGTEQHDHYQGSVTEFFGGDRAPDDSAIALMVDFPGDSARVRFMLEELAAWAANDRTRIMVNAVQVDRDGGPSRADLVQTPIHRIERIELIRGCAVLALYRRDVARAGHVFLTAPDSTG